MPVKAPLLIKSNLVPQMDSVDAVESYSMMHPHVKESLDCIDKAFADVGDDCRKMCISFNGGKDGTVLLPLINTVKVRRDVTGQLNCLYIMNPDPFPEMERFVDRSVALYNLNLMKLEGPAKQALTQLKSSPSGALIQDIFMGTRSTDLRCQISLFQMTDGDWPAFRRVSPILNWSYAQVWSFVLDLRIPYCSLYDTGYTSIGSLTNTTRNPKLKSCSPTGEEYYLPAHVLECGEHERCGRDSVQSC